MFCQKIDPTNNYIYNNVIYIICSDSMYEYVYCAMFNNDHSSCCHCYIRIYEYKHYKLIFKLRFQQICCYVIIKNITSCLPYFFEQFITDQHLYIVNNKKILKCHALNLKHLKSYFKTYYAYNNI
jgi:hypothetical protein